MSTHLVLCWEADQHSLWPFLGNFASCHGSEESWDKDSSGPPELSCNLNRFHHRIITHPYYGLEPQYCPSAKEGGTNGGDWSERGNSAEIVHSAQQSPTGWTDPKLPSGVVVSGPVTETSVTWSWQCRDTLTCSVRLLLHYKNNVPSRPQSDLTHNFQQLVLVSATDFIAKVVGDDLCSNSAGVLLMCSAHVDDVMICMKHIVKMAYTGVNHKRKLVVQLPDGGTSKEVNADT